MLEEMTVEQAVRRPSSTGEGIEPPPHPDAQPPTTPAEITAPADVVPRIEQDHVTFALWRIAALHENPEPQVSRSGTRRGFAAGSSPSSGGSSAAGYQRSQASSEALARTDGLGHSAVHYQPGDRHETASMA
ncbi:hypothetical protein [Streptomyces sp. NPDC058964]|uniref:hypothetical protein n=1 Tax=Streptomyces sp. NPDC058964 TaxID=3346681 RepID=UPI00368B217A